jgi:hypothetical protein
MPLSLCVLTLCLPHCSIKGLILVFAWEKKTTKNTTSLLLWYSGILVPNSTCMKSRPLKLVSSTSSYAQVKICNQIFVLCLSSDCSMFFLMVATSSCYFRTVGPWWRWLTLQPYCTTSSRTTTLTKAMPTSISSSGVRYAIVTIHILFL